MLESDFKDHPTIQALDAAIDALTVLRESGTKLVPVSPDVWRDFIAPPKAPTPTPEVIKPAEPAKSLTETLPAVPPPARVQRAATARAGDTPEVRAAAIAELNTSIQQCKDCLYAAEHRLLGCGTPFHPRVLIVNGACAAGDSPLAEGSRLEGDAGILLRKMFAAIDLTDEDLYITSVLKCPVTKGSPTPEALKACHGYLYKEIQTVQPQVIVMLGDVAAKAIFPHGAAASPVGQLLLFNGKIPAMKLHHPMKILMSEANDIIARPMKLENWNALKVLRAELNRQV